MLAGKLNWIEERETNYPSERSDSLKPSVKESKILFLIELKKKLVQVKRMFSIFEKKIFIYV